MVILKFYRGSVFPGEGVRGLPVIFIDHVTADNNFIQPVVVYVTHCDTGIAHGAVILFVSKFYWFV